MAIEARLATLEDSSSSSARIIKTKGTAQEQEGQRTTRAAAAEFHEDSCEEETLELTRQVIQTAGMEVEKIDIRCPTKPITHANKFIRSANRQIVP